MKDFSRPLLAGLLPGLLPGLLAAILAVAALWTLPGRAQDVVSANTEYDVELVVFRHLDANASGEDWLLEERLAGNSLPAVTDDEGPPVGSTTSSFPPLSVSGPQNRQALPRDRYRLTALASALQRARGYRPVAHFGWTQVSSPLNAAASIPLEDFLPPNSGLAGSAALARGRYLHLTLDLRLARDDQMGSFVLRQSRRMRSTERHYFDHPQFGVIALVTPRTAVP